MSFYRFNSKYLLIYVCVVIVLLAFLFIKIDSNGDNPTAPSNTPPSSDEAKKATNESYEKKKDDEEVDHKHKEEFNKTEGHEKPHQNQSKDKPYHHRNSDEPQFDETSGGPSDYKSNELPRDFRNGNSHSSACDVSNSENCNIVEESSSETFINAEESFSTNIPPQTSGNSQNSNLDQEIESNNISDEIPQEDLLFSFKNSFYDSEIEDSSSLTNQRRTFENFEDKIDYLGQEINSRYRTVLYGFYSIYINRKSALEDSLDKILNTSPSDLRKKPRVYFENEQGIDVGGLTKEWLELIIKNALNPDIGYFSFTNDKNTTLRPSTYSGFDLEHLKFYKFVGRILGMAIINKYNVGAYFDKSVFKSILKKKCTLSDLEEIDPVYYNSLLSIKNTPIADLGIDITFDHEVNEFGVSKNIDLIPNGRNIVVTDENKNRYLDLKAHIMLYGIIKNQLKSLREGLYDVIDPDLISIFTESELELLICGNPKIDVEDWKNNTIYLEYNSDSNMIIWFWRVVEEFSQSERAKLLQFVTGSSKVPFGGFAHLKSNGDNLRFKIIRMYSIDPRSLPKAHTCFNELELPEYPTYEYFKEKILLAINEGSDGFEML